jgi:hypothetical protein
MRRTMKTRIIYALLVLAVVLVLGPAQVASAATPIFVRTAGNDSLCNGTVDLDYDLTIAPGCAVKTIARGIVLGEDDGTISVGAGTYTETVTVDKAVSIIGNEAGYATWAPGDTRTVNANAAGNGFSITANWVIVKGFEIKNATGGYHGVSITTGIEYVTAQNLNIHDSDHGILSEGITTSILNNLVYNSDYGIRSEGPDSIIQNNVVYSATNTTYGFGIWVGGASDASGAKVQYNEVRDNRIGIQVGSGSSNGSTGADITYNSIHDYTTFGLVNDGETGAVNAAYNWWGTGCPDFGAIISGSVDYDPRYINAKMTYDSNLISTINQIYADVSSALVSQGIVSNIGDVTGCNFTTFSGLYFEKRTNVADAATAIGRITFNSALDLSEDETTAFLQGLGTKMEQGSGRIVFDARTSAVFAATGATLVMYNLPLGITVEQLIVRNDLGTILDASTVVSFTTFSQDPVTGDVTFTAAHFTQFDIAPIVTSITRFNPSPTSAASVDFLVAFSEFVTGVGTSDFTLTASGVSGASVTGVSGSGSVYTVTVNTGFGSGTLRLDVTDNNSILDAAGNPLGGTGVGDGDFSGQTYAVARKYVFLPLVLR